MAGDLTAKKSNFVSRWMESIVTILDNLAELEEMQDEATYLNYGVVLVDDDLVGENDHLTKVMLVDSFQSLSALLAFLEANNNTHYKAFYNIKR